VMRTMARCQAESGLEVHVATTDDNGGGRLASASELPTSEDSVTYWIFRRQTHFYTFTFPLTRWLWRHAKEYDVVHIHALFSYVSVVAAVCAGLAGVPYIVRPLGTLSRWGMRNRRRWLKRLSFRMIESRILRGAAGVHYTSEQEAVEAERLGVRHHRHVIPNPVDLPAAPEGRGAYRAAHPELDGRTIVLFLSRLDPKKGLDLLLPAFALVRAQHPEAILVVAGEGEPAFVSSLKRRASRLCPDAGIIWTGHLSGDNKRDLLADADVFVLPSYSENFGVAVVEAMGAGVPVIVSDQVGIHREISRAEAGIVVECSVEQLASALAKAVHDAPLRTRMGANAAGLARQFSPHLVARRFTELYARIRSQRHQPVARLRARRQEPIGVTAVVLTYNEESNLEACLQSIAAWTSAILVVDSGSTDGTAEIAKRHGARILRHPFQSHTRQWRWALDQAPPSAEWILALDADQRIMPELRDELCRLFRDCPDELAGIDGMYIKRRQVFRGRWIKFGGYYPKYLLKLFRRAKLLVDDVDLVDHHFYVGGTTRKLRFDLIEENHKEDDITFWIEKHNRYAARLAEEEIRRKAHIAPGPIAPALLGSPDQRTLRLKAIWRRLPRFLRPALYFGYRYFLRLGFLDGKQGFIFHFLQGFWFRLLIDIKLDEGRLEPPC
jgi:glycosyltransferase involved in cell wall biosynthesis